MRIHLRSVTLALLFLAACSPAGAGLGVPLATQSPRDAEATRFVDSVLAALSIEEKVGQLTMSPAEGMQTGPRVPQGSDAQVRAGLLGSVIGVQGAARTHEMQRIAVEESSHRIPLLFSFDVIHGYRTEFPVPLAEAASFDPKLAETDARIAAIEATANGITWSYAPMVDIARDSRWGRIVEGSGEDPYLGGVMAAARVRGFQGVHLSDSTSVLATAKHFAAYGAAESGRDYSNAEMSERTFYETYLPPFRSAVDAGAGSVMAGFSSINGSPPHASAWLLRDVLRKQLRFNGLVVSDWSGIVELIPHGVAADTADAGRLALRAGVDVDMVDGVYTASLARLARGDAAARTQIDEAVRHVLLAKYHLGLFSSPYHGASVANAARETLSSEHIAAARAAARESMVLLKNANATLPLSRSIGTLAVIGALAADDTSAMGPWSAAGHPGESATVLDGLRRANPAMKVRYAAGALSQGADTSGVADAVSLAREADAVVLVLGESGEHSGEAESRAILELPFAQLQLAQRVTRASRGKPLIALLMNGRALAIPWIADSVPAILETWYLGTTHGDAIADVLFGDYAPSGKLPITFPRATGQVPIYYAHRNTGRPHDPRDKYTTGYNDLSLTPLFPFGFGLSYTTFRYSDVRVSDDHVRGGDSIGVTMLVSNTGAREGDEVAQLYLRDDVASVARPVKQLVRFARVHLKAGESLPVSFTLGPNDLAFYDLGMRRIVEPGAFTVFAGTNSDDTHEAHFVVTGDTLVLAPAPPRMP